MYSTPVDLSFFYLRSAVEASLDTKKVSDGTKQFVWFLFLPWRCLLPVQLSLIAAYVNATNRRLLYTHGAKISSMLLSKTAWNVFVCNLKSKDSLHFDIKKTFGIDDEGERSLVDTKLNHLKSRWEVPLKLTKKIFFVCLVDTLWLSPFQHHAKRQLLALFLGEENCYIILAGIFSVCPIYSPPNNK